MRRNSRAVAFLLAVLGLIVSEAASGHARLLTPQPRSNSDGLKTGPCGGLARTAANSVYQPGQTIQVSWEETIDHPGYYLIEFSAANDANFIQLAQINDTAAGPLPHRFTANVTLPNITCSACTLRMTQMMTENPSLPSPYFSCADIQLSTNGQPLPMPGGPNTSQSGIGTAGFKPVAEMAGGCNAAAAAADSEAARLPTALIFAPLLLGLLLRRRVR